MLCSNLKISNLGTYLKVEINWSDSAVENTKWVFECQYNNESLICKNGKQIESYPVKNGVRIYGAGEDPNYISEKTVKQNLKTTIKIQKGNLKSALNSVDYFGDKNEAMKFYKNMTLKINHPDLSKCIFVKIVKKGRYEMKNLKFLLVLLILAIPLSGICSATRYQYDKYGHKTGSYKTYGSTTFQYDKYDNRNGYYKTNSSGRTIKYDKYGHKLNW